MKVRGKRKGNGFSRDFTRGGKNFTLPKSALDEPDPDWKKWFGEVFIKRGDLKRRKTAGVVRREVNERGESVLIFRKKADPEPASSWIRKEARKFDAKKITDLQAIRETWANLVGPGVAFDSDVVSFAGGTLTVDVFNSPLLQEMRQFHMEPLLKDLRDAWPAENPLVRIKFRPGRKDG